MLAFAIFTACGGSGSGSGSTSDSGTHGADASTVVFGSEGSATAGSGSGSGDAGTTGPLPSPVPDPGSCGWSGDAFACGWAPDPAHTCPAGTAAGGSCPWGDAGPPDPCCLDGTTLLRCRCDANACEPMWETLDCAHGPGAGACGWGGDLQAYVCGGSGQDPGGTPIACPPMDTGSQCDGLEGTTCCGSDGNAYLCTGEYSNGVSNWIVTQCTVGG